MKGSPEATRTTTIVIATTALRSSSCCSRLHTSISAAKDRNRLIAFIISTTTSDFRSGMRRDHCGATSTTLPCSSLLLLLLYLRSARGSVDQKCHGLPPSRSKSSREKNSTVFADRTVATAATASATSRAAIRRCHLLQRAREAATPCCYSKQQLQQQPQRRH
jgi:hypothetical protein